jgi:hypothetical protein
MSSFGRWQTFHFALATCFAQRFCGAAGLQSIPVDWAYLERKWEAVVDNCCQESEF